MPRTHNTYLSGFSFDVEYFRVSLLFNHINFVGLLAETCQANFSGLRKNRRVDYICSSFFERAEMSYRGKVGSYLGVKKSSRFALKYDKVQGDKIVSVKMIQNEIFTTRDRSCESRLEC